MRSPPAAITTHYNTRKTTMAHAIKITRTDAVVYGFTEHDVDDTVSGQLYSSRPGLQISSIVIAAGLATGNLKLTTLHDGSVFTTAEIHGKVWSNAAWSIIRYNWASLSDGADTILSGTFGEVELGENEVEVELRDLRQYLQQPVGDVTSKTCRYRLGSTSANAGGLCLKSISGAPWTVSGTLTGVTSNQVFQDTGRAEAADYFGEGQLTWTGGNNSGLTVKVKSFASGGTFTLSLPMLSTVQVGDTYTAVVGCRKRLEEDCRDKFANQLNFGGEPHAPGLNAITAAPGADV